MSWLLITLAKDFPRFNGDDEAGLHQLATHGLVNADFVRRFDRPDQRFTGHYSDGKVRTNRPDNLEARQPGPVMPSIETDITDNRSDTLLEPPSYRGPLQGREESLEERILRRRRREAMVIGEEGRPFDLANVVQHHSDDDNEGGDTGGSETRAVMPWNLDVVFRDVRTTAAVSLDPPPPEIRDA